MSRNQYREGHYSATEDAIKKLENCQETMMKIFNDVKSEYENLPYQSRVATNLRNIFDDETVTKFNNCCNAIGNYITCLKNANKYNIIAEEESNIL